MLVSLWQAMQIFLLLPELMWIFLLQDEMSDENWQLICRLKKQLGIP
jgi:hypothetical protein